MRVLFAIASLLALSAHAQTAFNSAVVYGDDDRVEVYEAGRDTQRLARSTAVKIFRRDLFDNGLGQYLLKGRTLAEEQYMCASERFVTQPVAAECSGFLVGPDLMVTAGHCIEDQQDCDSSVWVFDYQMTPGRSTLTTVPVANSYGCSKVIRKVIHPSGVSTDYALIQLDRSVPRAPLAVRRQGSLPGAARLTLIGAGAKLPTKVSPGGRVIQNRHPEIFTTNNDSFEGNSGAAVINEETLEVEGIVVRGAEDYEFDGESLCTRVRRCPPSGCNPAQGQAGEEVMRITAIPELREQQNVLNAAGSGQMAIIQQYLDRDGWVDVYDNQRQSMLFKAIEREQFEIMRELIARGADVNLQDLRGETPLHLAVRAKNLVAVGILVAARADGEVRNARGERAIDLCRGRDVKQRRIRALLQTQR